METIKPASDKICKNCQYIDKCGYMEKSRYFPGTCPKFKQLKKTKKIRRKK